MSVLPELQHDFSRAMITRDPATLSEWLADATPAAALLIYADTVYGTLIEALHAIYPVLERLLGVRCFDALARRYVEEYPSLSGDLHDYGATFADLLQQTSVCDDYPFLPDIARLEWLIHRVFHAADSIALDRQRLQALSPTQYARLRMHLAPACALLYSEYPIHRIWEVNQPHANGELCVTRHSTPLLIRRPRHQVELQPLSPARYALLRACADGSPLPDAFDQALAVDASCDPTQLLAQAMTQQILTDFTVTQEHDDVCLHS